MPLLAGVCPSPPGLARWACARRVRVYVSKGIAQHARCGSPLGRGASGGVCGSTLLVRQCDQGPSPLHTRPLTHTPTINTRRMRRPCEAAAHDIIEARPRGVLSFCFIITTHPPARTSFSASYTPRQGSTLSYTGARPHCLSLLSRLLLLSTFRSSFSFLSNRKIVLSAPRLCRPSPCGTLVCY